MWENLHWPMHTHGYTCTTVISIHMAPVNSMNMATQRGPEGDGHRPWQAICHQSHVALSLCTAKLSDLFESVTVHVNCMCVCGCGGCLYQCSVCLPAGAAADTYKWINVLRGLTPVWVMRETFVWTFMRWFVGEQRHVDKETWKPGDHQVTCSNRGIETHDRRARPLIAAHSLQTLV